MKTVFVTGGGGYISTHTCVELLRAGYGVVVVDSVRAEALNRVEKITYKDLWCVKADVRDQEALDKIFKDFSIDMVIHSAGLNSMLSDHEILETLAAQADNPEAACEALVAQANQRGGEDNITVVVLRVPPGAPADPLA